MRLSSLAGVLCAIASWVLVSCASGEPTTPRSPVMVPAGPMSDRLDYWRGRYNRVFRDPNQTVFVDKPSEFMVACVGSLPDARKGSVAIDLGAGQGRNTFALAEAGYAVTAVDVSTVGLANIRAAADRSPWSVETLEADAFTLEFRPQASDLVVAIYFNVNRELGKKLRDAIKPGGAIIVEGFTSQCDLPTLREEFAGWEIITAETIQALPDWYWGGERREASVSRFFARKPRAKAM